MMKVAVIVFPGSNCDGDAQSALASMFAGRWGREVKGSVQRVWHKDTQLPDVDLVILPGGFSYGDYLRSGAMSARAPIMEEVRAHAARGGYVMGICNGFQILTEAKLLPGALIRNRDLRFICRNVHVRVEHHRSVYSSLYQNQQVIQLPVAHHDGNFRCDEATLNALEDGERILFRYCDSAGRISDASNINGSIGNIAGITNAKGNVLGMMPHPERACDPLTAGIEGRVTFLSLMENVVG